MKRSYRIAGLISAVLFVIIAVLYAARGPLRDIFADIRQPNLPAAQTYVESLDQVESLPQDVGEAEASVESEPEATPVTAPVPATESDNSEPASAPPVKNIPTALNLAVPFQSQAPRRNWALPFKEACEESSLIMADAFFRGRGLTVDEMETSILAAVDWQRENYGYYQDTTAAEVARLAKDYYGLAAELDTEVTVDNIKKHLAAGKLVIIPAAGRLLGNPNFTGAGPVYHMLVIRGWTGDKFITNDPGTRRGEAYLYHYDTIINAIHNWPRPYGSDGAQVSDEEILTGEKVLIVVGKR